MPLLKLFRIRYLFNVMKAFNGTIQDQSTAWMLSRILSLNEVSACPSPTPRRAETDIRATAYSETAKKQCSKMTNYQNHHMQHLNTTIDLSTAPLFPLRQLINASRCGRDRTDKNMAKAWDAYWSYWEESATQEDEGVVPFLRDHSEEAGLFWAGLPAWTHPLVWLMMRCGWQRHFALEVTLVQDLLLSTSARDYTNLVADYRREVRDSRPLRDFLHLRMSPRRLDAYLN